jgi:hypothetical protein
MRQRRAGVLAPLPHFGGASSIGGWEGGPRA